MNENSNVQVSEVKNGRKGDKSQFSELSEKSLTAKQADMPEKQQQINFCSKSSHEVIGEENECKEKVTMSCLDPSEHDHTQVINQAIAELSEDLVSSVSTNHEKTRFAKVWYPNGIPEADALLQYRPSRYESLNTDSDISELDEEENERLVVSKDNNANFKATVPENYPEIVESSFQSVGDRNAAFSSASPGRSLETELEFYAETQSSHKMDSMMLSDGNFPSQNVGTLWKQLMKERKDRQECIFLMEQLQLDYDNLLQKYARAENAIDVLRIYKGNEANNYPRPSYSKDYLHHQPLAKPGCNNDDGDDLDFSQPITNHKRSSKSSRKRTSFSDLPSNSASQNTTEGIPDKSCFTGNARSEAK